MNNESTLRSNSSLYNEGTRQKQTVHEIVSSTMNARKLVDDNGYLFPHVHDIDDEPKKNGQPVFIIGSGPSLDNSIEYLRDWEGGIICSSSQALTLMYHGVEPTHIVALDPFCTWDEIEGVDWSKTRTKLVIQPGVWPTLIANWPNEILLFLQNIGRPDSFYAATQRFMFARRDGLRNAVFNFLVRTEVTQFACSPPCQMFIANRFGYGPVFVSGLDFGFPNGKSRFKKWTPDPDEPGEWTSGDTNYTPLPTHVVANNGIPTEMIHLYYKKNFMSAWRLSLQKLWSLDEGIMPEIPPADIKEVIRKQGMGLPGGYHNKKIIEVTEQYLASVGAYVLETSNGLTFIESEDPLDDLPKYIANALRAYVCPKCNAQGNAIDDENHEGEICARCHEPLKRMVQCDADANMRRIGKLVKTVNEKLERENLEAATIEETTRLAIAATEGMTEEEQEEYGKKSGMEPRPEALTQEEIEQKKKQKELDAYLSTSAPTEAALAVFDDFDIEMESEFEEGVSGAVLTPAEIEQRQAAWHAFLKDKTPETWTQEIIDQIKAEWRKELKIEFDSQRDFLAIQRADPLTQEEIDKRKAKTDIELKYVEELAKQFDIEMESEFEEGKGQSLTEQEITQKQAAWCAFLTAKTPLFEPVTQEGIDQLKVEWRELLKHEFDHMNPENQGEYIRGERDQPLTQEEIDKGKAGKKPRVTPELYPYDKDAEPKTQEEIERVNARRKPVKLSGEHVTAEMAEASIQQHKGHVKGMTAEEEEAYSLDLGSVRQLEPKTQEEIEQKKVSKFSGERVTADMVDEASRKHREDRVGMSQEERNLHTLSTGNDVSPNKGNPKTQEEIDNQKARANKFSGERATAEMVEETNKEYRKAKKGMTPEELKQHASGTGMEQFPHGPTGDPKTQEQIDAEKQKKDDK